MADRYAPHRPVDFDVSIIGLGRIGLPLALSFADRGLRVLGIDKDPERLAAVRDRRMPFKEPGTDELIARVTLDRSSHAADAAQARAIVLTLGTPALSHIEIDMRDIRTVLDDLLPHLREDHLLVLRSTVAPGTTEFVAGYLEKHRGFRVGDALGGAQASRRVDALDQLVGPRLLERHAACGDRRQALGVLVHAEDGQA